MAGISLVELMIAMALGLVVLAGLAVLFANTSASRAEIDRSARQIENGRYALDLISEDLRLAGFYGELNLAAPRFNVPITTTTLGAIAGLPDPCSADPNVWEAAMPVHMQGYDNGSTLPTCMPGTIKFGTDVLVVRHVSACEAGVNGCPAATGNTPYLQVSKCATEQLVSPANHPGFVLGLMGVANFNLTNKDCATRAALRQYLVHIYYIDNDNGRGQAIPTLTRLEFNGINFNTVPLVEGIEEINFEYGIDHLPVPPAGFLYPDGAPDVYNADPSLFAAGGNAQRNWFNVVTTRIHLLARNTEASQGYTDTKTYTLGNGADGVAQDVNPGGAYRRHVYSGLVRIMNVAQRRDTP